MRFFTVMITMALVLCTALTTRAQVTGNITFMVSAEQPSTHYYHVTMTCTGVKGATLEVKLPAWTPGYYWLVNFAKNVVDFSATDNAGETLAWNKTNKNTWHINTGGAGTIILRYDVYAFAQSVAEPFLDEGRAYLSPAGVFMHVAGQLQQPVMVSLKPYAKWNSISTGLDAVKDKENTFTAPDFDVLYDCPILMGTQEVWSFEVQGIPHAIVLEEPEKFNKQQFTADLKRMVEAAVTIVGEIPYKHYTFLIMGEGRGGLEHRNSTAVFSSKTVYNPDNAPEYKRWLNFLTHEYFHLYNIKAIRPVALGPFDYDRENYTNMLWVSEGFTVYYEYLILNKAGILTREETLDFIRGNIRNYENVPGHLFQSATQASFDTWIQFFNHNENSSNTTISYYDKGAALGMLLDLAIRHHTGNKRSLDDVMRSLYQTFYKQKKRGFTDDEFRETCERVAGTPLTEIFNYASTVQPVDYATYLGYAGLSIDLELKKEAGVTFGAAAQEHGNDLEIATVEWNSAAFKAGLSAQDVILEINGQKASLTAWGELLKNSTPGEKVTFKVRSRNIIHDVTVMAEERTRKEFTIAILPSQDALQKSILNSWIR